MLGQCLRPVDSISATFIVPSHVASGMASPSDEQQAEIRLMGLILAQSIFVGVAVGVFDAGIWLNMEDANVNGMTYAMAAFAMQGLGYYVFKMFFQQGLDDRMHMQEAERRRQRRYQDMQRVFDSRREDMELRMQEAQMEQELRWMENNPGRTPSWASLENEQKIFNPEPPSHKAGAKDSINLGLSFEGDEEETETERERGKDGKFKKKKE